MANETKTFEHLPPSVDLYGVDDDGDVLHLAATISNAVYDSSIPTDKRFLEKLLSIPTVQEKYPNLSVQFFYTGVFVGVQFPTNDPLFTAIITDTENPETLILAWRGTKSPKDAVPTFNFAPADTMVEVSGGEVQVQGSFYELIQKYFNVPTRMNQLGKGDDLEWIVKTGTKDPKAREPAEKGSKRQKTYSPIKRIILTGHSLGGGLAQVAHQVLLSEFSGFSQAIKDNGVKMYTLSFSGLSSIAPKEGQAYEIENMTNFVLKDDCVPRIYGNVTFLNNFLKAVNTDDLGGVMGTLAGFLKKMLNGILNGNQEVLQKYHHVGKIIHYDGFKANPITYNNDEFNAIQEPGGVMTVEDALNYHLETVTGPGFSWA